MAIVGVGSSFKILSIEYEWKRELKHTIIVNTRLSRCTKYFLKVLSECREKILHDSQQLPPFFSLQKKPNYLLFCMFCFVVVLMCIV